MNPSLRSSADPANAPWLSISRHSLSVTRRYATDIPQKYLAGPRKLDSCYGSRYRRVWLSKLAACFCSSHAASCQTSSTDDCFLALPTMTSTLATAVFLTRFISLCAYTPPVSSYTVERSEHAVWRANLDVPPRCSIPAYPLGLSVSTFQRLFKGRYPVILTRPLSATAPVRAASSLPSLYSSTGGTLVLLASSNSYSHDKRKVSLGEYLTGQEYMGCTLAQSVDATSASLPTSAWSCPTGHGPSRLATETWYMFGDSIGDEWEDLTALYALPGDTGQDEGLPVFGVAGQYSGVAFHTHGAAWAEVLEGSKRWWLAPPALKPVFQGDQHQRDWATSVLPVYQAALSGVESDMEGRGYTRLVDAETSSSSLNGTAPLSEGERRLQAWLSSTLSTSPLLSCELGPGQVLYIPPQWWHATLNTGVYNTFISTFTREKGGTMTA